MANMTMVSATGQSPAQPASLRELLHGVDARADSILSQALETQSRLFGGAADKAPKQPDGADMSIAELVNQIDSKLSYATKILCEILTGL